MARLRLTGPAEFAAGPSAGRQSLLRNAVALDRTHLDRERGRPGDLSAPFERGAEVGRIDDVEAAQVLLALDVRAVRRDQCPVLCPDNDRRARREESVRRDSSAGDALIP